MLNISKYIYFHTMKILFKQVLSLNEKRNKVGRCALYHDFTSSCLLCAAADQILQCMHVLKEH